MFVAEKVLLLLVTSLTDNDDKARPKNRHWLDSRNNEADIKNTWHIITINILLVLRAAAVRHFHSSVIIYLYNSLWLSDAIWRQRPSSILIQAMTCRRFGAQPSSEPLLTVNWIFRKWPKWNMEQNLNDFIQKMHVKMSSTSYRPFWSGFNALTTCLYLDIFHQQQRVMWSIYFTACEIIKMISAMKTSTITDFINNKADFPRYLADL